MTRAPYPSWTICAIERGFSRAPEAHFLLGMALYRQKRWQEAADALETAATRLPLLGDYALHYGASAYRTLRLTAQAAASLSRLLRDYPESLLAERARQERAALYLDAGRARGGRGGASGLPGSHLR
ncbi:MAG: tetratricopeptide repeat protein [Candidatus Methylomirabilis sp.]|nr:tetratricopeptide repeat protein [Candidatus Methylomirabilis sp.]